MDGCKSILEEFLVFEDGEVSIVDEFIDLTADGKLL